MEDEEALETRTIVGKFPHFVHDRVNKVFTNGVVTASILRIVWSATLVQIDEKMSYSY